MSNVIRFGKEARAKLKEGAAIVNNSVAPTLGAGGRNVVYNKWSRVPIVSNDGVSIAREVEPEDLGQLQGANLIKQIAERTNDQAGDGTTTSVVLAYSMIDQGMQLLDSDAKVNPMQLRREMKEATIKVLDALKESAVECKTLESLEHVATISVEDSDMGKTIAKAVYDAGDTGIVYVNESEDIGVTIDKVEGYQFGQGMITPYLFSNLDRMESVMENPAVFVTELQLNYTNEFAEMMKNVVQKQGCKNILIICDEIHPTIVQFAVKNFMKGNFLCAIVKKPMQKEYLEDIAAVVGATAMTTNKGHVHPKIEYLGRCKKAVIKEKTTTLFMNEDKTKVDEYIKTLQMQLDNAEDEVMKTKLKERIAKFTEGVYMLNVGEKTEAEARYLKLKVDDAVAAVKAAREEGIVAGGGMALWNISSKMYGKDEFSTVGGAIVLKACQAPLARIVENSGKDYGEVCKEISVLTDGNPGYDALKLEVVPDMLESGIIDPVKVTRCALENASSFAGLLLTTETLITPIPQKEPVLPPM